MPDATSADRDSASFPRLDLPPHEHGPRPDGRRPKDPDSERHMDRKPALARWQRRALAAIPLLCTVLVAVATLAVLARATANARHWAALPAWATPGAIDLRPVVAVVLLGALANVIALLLCARARTRGVASEAVALERLDRQRGQLEQQVAEIESMDEALVERTELAERERELAEAAPCGRTTSETLTMAACLRNSAAWTSPPVTAGSIRSSALPVPGATSVHGRIRRTSRAS